MTEHIEKNVIRATSCAGSAKSWSGTLLGVIALLVFCTSTAVQASPDDLCPKVIARQPVKLVAAVNGWGLDNKNSRFVSSKSAGVNRENVKSLTEAWVFGLPETSMPHSQPLVTKNAVFIADEAGTLYALDRKSGCIRWSYATESSVRTAIRLVQIEAVPGKPAQDLLVFGDASAYVYAIDARSGGPVWQIKADLHDKAMISGSPAYHDGRLFVPVSSWEAFWAANPFYRCCTFRSSVLALDIRNGDQLWRTYTVSEPAKVVKKRWLLPDQWGPSGAPVWSAPTIDVDRNLLYVGTGENYSSPATGMSDAIIAMNLDNGDIAWSRQFLANDAWNVSCETFVSSNCPEERGVDLDFGAPPLLATIEGKDWLFAGQKNGHVYALNPDNGETEWMRKLGRGGKLGGIHFGMAADSKRKTLYVPVSDRSVEELGDDEPGEPAAGIYALDARTGATRWVTKAEPCVNKDFCDTGYSAAITVTDELLFAGALDGSLHAFDVANGTRLWRYDTARSFESVNSTPAAGGAIDLGGAYLADGQLFISSGYKVFGQQPGNAFIVLEIE